MLTLVSEEDRKLFTKTQNTNDLGDEDGNTPLMLAVRESPLNWPCLHTLIFFGAQLACNYSIHFNRVVS